MTLFTPIAKRRSLQAQIRRCQVAWERIGRWYLAAFAAEPQRESAERAFEHPAAGPCVRHRQT